MPLEFPDELPNASVRDVYHAFEMGWTMACRWANRPDLLDDINSPAFEKSRDQVLKKLSTIQDDNHANS